MVICRPIQSIGLLDFVLFAARRKELSVYSKFQSVIEELRGSTDDAEAGDWE